MIVNETNEASTQAKKDKIRARYKGVNLDELEVVPARRLPGIFDEDEERRVAVYARVSTDDPRQTSSYELQKNYYTDMVDRHPNWTLVDIYADEGISGTSLKHRDAFNRMVVDCKAGKIDIIVTKSVSRFARNIVDCISISRQLAAQNPPVEVFFETEHINTLNDKSEMSLAFTATMAQEESHTKSSIMNASVEMRFSHGIFLTPPLLGYDQDENGNLVINEEEARTVRLIFFMYLYGYTCQQIAEALTQLECKTKKGNTSWSVGSILQILKNERHCGDVTSRKTYTPSYLDHKSRVNRGERTQVIKRDHHEAIIARDDFIAVQRLISNAKYGNKGILPELRVVTEGALRGFVLINPRWAAFSVDDYYEASASVFSSDPPAPTDPVEIKAQDGDFDMRGFEIARSQFFNTSHSISITFTNKSVKFSAECVRKFPKTQYIEMLVFPSEHLFAVRPSIKTSRTSVKWSLLDENGLLQAKEIPGSAYASTLYNLFGWNIDCRYRVRGVFRQKGNEALVIFDLRDTEVFVPTTVIGPEVNELTEDMRIIGKKTGTAIADARSVIAYPSSWANSFGNNFYRHAQARELAALAENAEWNLTEQAKPFSDTPNLAVTDTEIIAHEIKQIINKIKQEAPSDDI